MLLVLPALFIVPHYRQTINRSRQKRTMADIRSIATAWEARATKFDTYSIGALRNSRVSARPVTTAELARSLEPTYIRHLPRADGWGTEFQFATGDEEIGGQAQTYMIRSLGSDRRSDRIANLTGSTTNFEDDMIYSTGSFIRYPESAG
jgi:general secretion pathway protein G